MSKSRWIHVNSLHNCRSTMNHKTHNDLAFVSIFFLSTVECAATPLCSNRVCVSAIGSITGAHTHTRWLSTHTLVHPLLKGSSHSCIGQRLLLWGPMHHRPKGSLFSPSHQEMWFSSPPGLQHTQRWKRRIEVQLLNSTALRWILPFYSADLCTQTLTDSSAYRLAITGCWSSEM